MLHIFCPHCGELRSEEEFHASGQAHIPRPLDPNACTDKEWGDYMFFRDNPRGLHHELWNHVAGCRQFFNATRNTVTYERTCSRPTRRRCNCRGQEDAGCAPGRWRYR